MGIIRLNQIKAYGHHGCLNEEEIIGGNYEVDVEMHTDFSEAAEHDDLSKTIDYVSVNQIVEEEVAKRSKLIEQVVWRIGERMKAEFPSLDKAVITLKKINPPINGNVRDVSVSIEI
ncbi:MAG: dihydroneopterin aldolase [Flavobacteriales bacterium]